MDTTPILLQIGSSDEGPWAFINSAFFSAMTSSLIGALAGAFAGAYGAHYIAERSKKKEYLQDQIKSINIAISTGANICSMFLVVKEQHIKNLKDDFNIEFQKLRQAQKDAKLKQGLHTIAFVASLESFPELSTPIDLLQEVIYSKISITGRPLAMANQLKQSAISFNDYIKQRNIFIEDLRVNPPSSSKHLTAIYFGLEIESGRTDRRYPSLIDALYMACDDCIYFSYVTTNDLMKHGQSLKKEFKRLFKEDLKITTANFGQSEHMGLIPPSNEYPSWSTSFYESQEEYEKSLKKE